jgi:uncharacterized protein YdbL (DUF1318 family)
MNYRKLFTAVAAVAALGAASTGAMAQSTSQKALVDQAKAAGSVGEQADGYLGVRTTVDGDTQAAVNATNAGRRQVYTRSAAEAGTTADVAGARMFETQLLSRVSTGQWYKNAAGQWVQR